MCGGGGLFSWEYGVLEHLQPFAPPTVESGGNYRRIGQKSGVGSAELPAGPPAIRPEIGVFDFIFTNRRSSSANFIQFANIRLK
jgi:hypothetical protein